MCNHSRKAMETPGATRIITTTTILALVSIVMLFCSSVVLGSLSIVSGNVYAQSITEPSKFLGNGPQSDKDPIFLDSYWTDNLSTSTNFPSNNTYPVKKEIGPGEGASTLAVVLVNRGRSDITGITGYLSLPSGFEPIAGKDNGTSQSVASFYSTVKAGQTFILYFDVYVLNQAKVGAYSAILGIKYSKILQVGEISSTTTVPFRLPGKVILDAVSNDKKLVPAALNELDISIQNKGTANATGVIVSIEGITGSSGSSVSGTNTTTNTGKTPSIPLVTVGNNTFDIGIIPPSRSVQIKPKIYCTSSAGETAQNLALQISYGDAYGNKREINSSVGLIISPNPQQSILSLTSEASTHSNTSSILTAGRIQDLNLTLMNNAKKPVTDLVISLVSKPESVKILGDSRWTDQIMMPQSKINLSTKVFASEDMIGKPAIFTLTTEYISENQSKTDNLNFGAYITGIIKIRAYDIAINYIGNKPNLVGNLLNEGNTVGLFTTIEMIKPPSYNKSSITSLPVIYSSYPSSLQYLGDLSKDSPLPFSIPLELDNSTITKGHQQVYSVLLKITYNDDLRIPHQVIVNKTVSLEPKEGPSTNQPRTLTLDFGIGLGLEGIIVITTAIAAVIIIATVFIIIIRRRRRARKERLKSRVYELDGNKNIDLFSQNDTITPNDKEGVSKDVKEDREEEEEEGSDKKL